MSFLYSRWDESFGDGSGSGSVDAGYLANWLVSPSPMQPVRNSGGLSMTATAPASRTVGIVAAVNTSGSANIGGNALAPTLGADGINLNPFALPAPAGSSSMAVTVSGSPAVLGLAWIGQVRQLERQLLTEPEFDYAEPYDWVGEAPSIAPYDPGVTARRLTGDTIVSDTGLNDIHAWHASTRRGTKPTLIVPVDDINDAWLVHFRYRWRPVIYLDAAIRAAFPTAKSVHRVSFEFQEIPRVRWP